MTEIAIQVEALSKKYLIGGNKARSVREAVNLRIQSLFAPAPVQDEREFWALKEVSFTIHQGDVVGIVGKNGAGKSTLLKILSKITKPTSGKIEVYGRIASLLEVGTGFHPELTGRENIFLNGTILGMSRSEVNAKFEEIVEFSGVEKFIDTPVKRYSSGMTVRLAFAVAAHLEPEILIVDEVLAVGDADFQKKCLGKMGEVSKKEGRTILFVSHGLPALKAICHQGILLDKGRLVLQSDIHEVIKTYSSTSTERETILESLEYYQSELMEVLSIQLNEQESPKFILDEPVIRLKIDLLFKNKTPFELDVHLKWDDHYLASYANFVKHDVTVFEPGRYSFDYLLRLPDLLSGNYEMDLYFTVPYVKRHIGSVSAIRFEMVNGGHSAYVIAPGMTWGKVLMEGTVTHSKNDL